MRYGTRVRPRFVILIAALAAAPLRAEIPRGYDDIDRSPPQLAREIFDAKYGQLLVAEFGRILRDSADAECLRSRALDPASLEARGHELLVRAATRFLEIAYDLIDPVKFEAAVAKRAGKNAKAELAALRKDPDVHRYLELSKPSALAKLANQVAENIDRHALLRRIPLKRGLSPLGTGNMTLLQAGEDLENATDRFLESRTSPSFKRFLEIGEAIAEAMQEATNQEAFLRMGPVQLTPGVEAGLADLCIFPKR